MQKVKYTVSFHGQPFEQEPIQAAVCTAVMDLGIDESAFEFLNEGQWAERDLRSPHIVLFFGYEGGASTQHDAIGEAVAESQVVIPIVRSLSNFRSKVPVCIRGVNGLEFRHREDVNGIASLVLENFGLLRKSRRLFISYRRIESAAMAMQLYDFLDSKGFQVFLDTRGLRPGTDFQSELWQSFADSDVVVLLDTPKFRGSEWTRLELERAYETNVQVLHLLWPGVNADKTRSLSNFYFLDRKEFKWRGWIGSALLTASALGRVSAFIESLRARALASRHRYLSDNFCDSARDLAQPVQLQPDRYIVWKGPTRTLAIFPAVGVPDALRVEDIEQGKRDSGADGVRVLFDDRGITPRWLDHLAWLNSHVRTKLVKASEIQELLERDTL